MDERPVVVLDSTALIADPKLTSRPIQVLLGLAADRMIRLFVPRVVLTEVAAHRARAVAAELNRMAKAADRWFISEVQLPNPVDDQASYLDYLHQKLANATILELPTISHHDLLERAVKHQHPFTPKGTGYRDALIWRNFVEVVRANPAAPTAVFVTNNTSDFGASVLHSDLRQELEDEGIVERVRLAAEPHHAVALVATPASDALAAFRTRLEDDHFTQHVTDLIAREIDRKQPPSSLVMISDIEDLNPILAYEICGDVFVELEFTYFVSRDEEIELEDDPFDFPYRNSPIWTTVSGTPRQAMHGLAEVALPSHDSRTGLPEYISVTFDPAGHD